MYSVFEFKNWKFDTQSGQLDLFYHDSKYGDFCEQFFFPQFEGNTLATQYLKRQSVIDRALDQLFWMVGVSYYKTQLADKFEFKHNKPAVDQAAWLTQTWQSGLAELAHQNQLPWLTQITFPCEDKLIKPVVTEQPLKPRSLVAIGGGKDSLVSIELLKHQQEEICLFMVGNSAFIQSVANHTECKLLQVKRRVDPSLQQANEAGAFNGHVPITAINSCVAAVAALLYDFDAIVFSNERSADVGNVQMENGQWVNHQYSKSFEFEQAFQNLVHQHIDSNLSYFSLLRPFSELAIVEQFSKMTPYFPYFSSCNRNFHLMGSQNKKGHWCGECPKCAFVYLMLAVFLLPEEMDVIFGKNLLEDAKLEKLFAELLGLEGIKPFECVGEVEESRWALRQLTENALWQSAWIVNKFKPAVSSFTNNQESAILFNPSDLHLIPKKRKFSSVFNAFSENRRLSM